MLCAMAGLRVLPARDNNHWTMAQSLLSSVLEYAAHSASDVMRSDGVRCLLVVCSVLLRNLRSGGRTVASGAAETKCSTREGRWDAIARKFVVHGTEDATVGRECAHRVSVELEFQTTSRRSSNTKIDARAASTQGWRSRLQRPRAVCSGAPDTSIDVCSAVSHAALVELWQAIEVAKKWQRGRKKSKIYRYLIGSHQ